MNNRLLVDAEILRSRLLIRDFFLLHSTTEIYENIGQVLSLVNLQLDNLDPADPSQLQFNHDLIKTAIRDLRSMSSSFFPEEVLAGSDGFHALLMKALGAMYTGREPAVEIVFADTRLWFQARFLCFSFILELLSFFSGRSISCGGLLLRFHAGVIEIVLEELSVGQRLVQQGMTEIAGYGGFANALLLMNGEWGITGGRAPNLEIILKPDFNE